MPPPPPQGRGAGGGRQGRIGAQRRSRSMGSRAVIGLHTAMGAERGAQSPAPQRRSPLPNPPPNPSAQGTTRSSHHTLRTPGLLSRKSQGAGWAAVSEGRPEDPPPSHPDLLELRGLVAVQDVASFSFMSVRFYRNTTFMHRLFTVQPSLAYHHGVRRIWGGGSERVWDNTAAPGAAARPASGRGGRVESTPRLSAGCSPSAALLTPGHRRHRRGRTLHSSAAAAQEEGRGASGREGAASSSVPALNLLLGLSFPSSAVLGGRLRARFALLRFALLCFPSLFPAAPKQRSPCRSLRLLQGCGCAARGRAPPRGVRRNGGSQPKAGQQAAKREQEANDSHWNGMIGVEVSRSCIKAAAHHAARTQSSELAPYKSLRSSLLKTKEAGGSSSAPLSSLHQQSLVS